MAVAVAVAVAKVLGLPKRIKMAGRKKDDRENQEKSIQAYIPPRLRRVVFACHGDFCQTPIFHPLLIAQLMAEGFLPIATENILLPKLHRHRCVIRLPDDLHISKSVRKKSKGFRLTINQDFDAVVEACHEQHGSVCWLYPPLVQAFRHLQDGMQVSVDDSTEKCPVRLYSIEVWNEQDELVAGELGYTVGSIYTSLTGFYNQDCAGSIQLATLGRFLSQKGFELWDLGMEMDYKRNLGSHLMPREAFVQQVQRVRVTHGNLTLTCNEPVSCKTIIDQGASSTEPTTSASSAPTPSVPTTTSSVPQSSHSVQTVHPMPFTEDKSPNKKARGSPPSIPKSRLDECSRTTK